LDFVHDEIGYNYRLPNINAALACAQLERLDAFVYAKRVLAEHYARMLGSAFVMEPLDTQSNYWLSTLLLDSKAERDTFLCETQSAGIATRPCWRPLPLLPMYRGSLRAADGLGTAFDLAERIVNLPSSPKLAAQLL
jgi:perosamine synthetase